MGVVKKASSAMPNKKVTKAPPASDTFDDFLDTLDSSDVEEEEELEDGEGESEDDDVEENGNHVEEEESEDGEDEDDDEIELTEEKPQKKGKKPMSKVEEEASSGGSEEEEEEEEGDDDPEKTVKEHKKTLQRLQETDPDFFQFLQENDADLLNFEDSGEDEESEDDDEDKVDPLHKPPEELEEASDSEAEEERVDTAAEGYKSRVEKFVRKGIVNLEVIKDWEEKLSTTRELAVFGNVIEAFECAVNKILEDEDSTNQKWNVEGSGNFNALVRLCIRHVKSFCVRYLCGSNNLTFSEQKFDQRPMECKDKAQQKWSKLRSKLRNYMITLVKFLKSMGNTDAVASILRHCQKMGGFWALLATKSFKLVKTLINIWATGEDTCRVLAFLAIIRIANYNREVFLMRLYKQMYMAYVANSKFTSANTWSVLNLMRSSLTEVYLLDPSLTYSVAFPFIRQLAIHLRNALTAGTTSTSQTKQNKKEASRIVYSWQFVHSLHLWVEVLSHSHALSNDNLKLLVYPVVQICLGTIKLIPTKKYIPLRFMIIRMLIKLQEKTGVFIPILPLVTEVLIMTDFSAKSVSKFSVRPLDMTCCLKADPTESGYAKAVSETVFELLLRACKAVATELSFPEILTPTLMQLRSFLKKKCRNPEVCRKYKTLLEKIDANSKYIAGKRDKALESGSLSLSDGDSQKILRVQMETSKPHPPILDFATEYLKVNAKAQAKLRKINVETREEKLIPKPAAHGSKQQSNKQSAEQLLEYDEDDDDSFHTKLDALPDEDQESEEIKPAKKKKLKRKMKESVISKKKLKKTKIQHEFEAQDELVDLDLSD